MTIESYRTWRCRRAALIVLAFCGLLLPTMRAEAQPAGAIQIDAWLYDRGNAKVFPNPDMYADDRDKHPGLVVGDGGDGGADNIAEGGRDGGRGGGVISRLLEPLPLRAPSSVSPRSQSRAGEDPTERRRSVRCRRTSRRTPLRPDACGQAKEDQESSLTKAILGDTDR